MMQLFSKQNIDDNKEFDLATFGYWEYAAEEENREYGSMEPTVPWPKCIPCFAKDWEVWNEEEEEEDSLLQNEPPKKKRKLTLTDYFEKEAR